VRFFFALGLGLAVLQVIVPIVAYLLECGRKDERFEGANAATLLEIAAGPKHLGADIGFLRVLHTWGKNLQHHPHIHCVIPAGGLSRDRQHWIHPRYASFRLRY
jgi:hypothetical protein